MIDTKMDTVLIYNIKNVGINSAKQIIAECKSINEKMEYGYFPLTGFNISDNYPELIWGMLITSEQDEIVSDKIGIGFLVPFNMPPETTNKDEIVSTTTPNIYSETDEWIYIINTDSFALKYNEDCLYIGNDTNNIIIDKGAIIINGTLVKNASEKANFFVKNDVGQKAPCVMDPSMTLFPELPSFPYELTKILQQLNIFKGL